METDPTQRQRIWQSVMFYNYLQVTMGGLREAGTATQYSQACEACFEVMEQYQPQYIIAWGNRLWEKLPSEYWDDGTNITVDGYCVPTGSYTLKNGMRVKAMAVNHPSVGYSWDYWHKVITAFLK